MDSSPFPPQFHPIVTAWFQRRFGEPSPPQRLGWPLIADRRHTLILAPTGSGKTLAAFLACLDALIHELLEDADGVQAFRRSGVQAEQTERLSPRTPECLNAVRILYVSPLKALNYDIEKNLREPLAGLAEEAERQGFELPEIRVGVRTGDTRSKERQQMVRRPPHILITTPESLHLILTSQAQAMLRGVQFLILDEIHALCNNKRGVFTSLLFERLEEVRDAGVQAFRRSGIQGDRGDEADRGAAGRERPACPLGRPVNGPGDPPSVSDDQPASAGFPADRPTVHGGSHARNTRTPEHLNTSPLVRIGLSATQRPLEEVARYLGGAVWQGDELVPRPVEIVDAGMRKRLSLKVLCPVDDLAHLEAGTLWPGITRRLLGLVAERRSTIVFANNRRQVERLTAQLNEAAREEIALPHHGSIAAPVRRVTEERLKRGDVRAVCATGTLELGIDMGAVDLVCQVESPRQVSKGLQRVGRAGHLMSAVSEGRILAKQPLDLLEAAVLGREMLAGRVENLRVPRNCLDVLAQQLVAIVADGERSLADLYRLVRRSYCYHNLPEAQFHGTVAMIAGRYPSHLFRDLRARVSLDRVQQRLLPLPGSQRAALTNGGTIPDTGQFGVYTADRRLKLGELDEEFIYESRVGDVFSLGIDTWRIDRIEADRVLVSPAPGSPARMPFWRGESYGREPELGRAMGEFVAEVEARLDDPGLEEWIAGEVPVDETGAHTLAAYLRHGREATGGLPTHRTLLVESFEDEIGERRLAILSPLGRRVHLTLRLALTAVVKEQLGVDPEALHNDDGLLLRLPGGEAQLPLDLLRRVPPEAVWELVVGQLASSPLFGLRFRQNAARALLLPSARPGKRTPLWLQRLKAKDLLTVASGYDEFPIVLETYRECLEEFLAVDTVRDLLTELRAGTVTAVESHRTTPSPFVSTLLFDFQAIHIYEWDRPKGIGRIATEAQQRLVADLVGHLRQATGLLDPRTLAEREARLQGTAPDARARTPAEFLELLRRLGDLPADDDAIASRYTGDARVLLRALCADRLLVQVPLPGAERPWHWILTEEWALYRDAFLSGVQAFGRSGVQGHGRPASPPPGTAGRERPACSGERPVNGPGESQPVSDDQPASAGFPPDRPTVHGGSHFPPPEHLHTELPNTLLVRVAEDREVALETAVPAAFLDEGAARDDDAAAQARQFIVRRFALHRMLVSAAEVAAWHGLDEGEAEAILRELETLGTLVHVPGESGSEAVRPSSGQVITPSGHQVITDRWASPEHLEGAYIATLARRRREARPASLAQFQQFLLTWQHRAPAEATRSGAPLAGQEGVQAVLAQLQGLSLPATVWEGEVLARRVRPYQPADLDRACEFGAFVWQGGGATAGAVAGRGRVAFFQREVFPFWPSGSVLPAMGSGQAAGDRDLPECGRIPLRQRPPDAEFFRTPASSPPLSEQASHAPSEHHPSVIQRVAQMLQQRGASFLIDLALATGIDSREVAAALWELIWQGRVTHDRWAVIRAGPPAGRASTSSDRPLAPGRRPVRGMALTALRRPQLSVTALSRGGGPSGRYSWLPALRAEPALPPAEAAELVARQMLERYGIVVRELLELESVPLSWAALYDALNRMELTGEIRRGYFVEGFSGAQFGLPRACDDLKAIQERGAPALPHFVLLNACDPANLYGTALREAVPDEEPAEDERGEEAMAPGSPLPPNRQSLPRLPTNYLVLRDGAPVLLLEAAARRLTPVVPMTGDELAAACATLRELMDHPWPLRPFRQFRLERWADRPIRGSEAEAPLRALGFSASPKGLEL